MDIKETYYSALVDYRKHTLNNKDCARQRKLIARANADIDEIEVVRNECEIDDDWIEAIEIGLDFIDKAIREERQFILSNGEVLPIEKVKNVSTESVEHLAKHSNLLTRKPKNGADLIPDKLYSVERLTDYSVYENRFLYMLLCYLRDFISLRYNALVDLTTTYDGKLKINKKIASGNRNTTIEINLDEKLKNDLYLHNHNSAKEKIRTIDGLLKAVLSFLATPLMEAVSSAPMLKPPITETNVLKMNKNFKGAMKLYYFITAYDKKGYTVNKVVQKVKPFKESVAEDLAEVVELCSFLTYEHGLGISSEFKAEYEAEQKRLQEQEQLKKVEQLKALQRRIKENGDSPEEYLLLLEQRNRVLEGDSVQLVRAKAEITAYEEKLQQSRNDIASLQESINELNEQITQNEQLVEELNQEHQQELQTFEESYKQKDLELQNKFSEKVKKLQSEMDAASNVLSKKMFETQRFKEQMEKEFEGLQERVHLAEAKVNAIKKQTGLYDGDEDYTSQEGFGELEKQYNAFKALFKEQWKNTKRKIRKQYMKTYIDQDKKTGNKNAKKSVDPSGNRVYVFDGASATAKVASVENALNEAKAVNQTPTAEVVQKPSTVSNDSSTSVHTNHTGVSNINNVTVNANSSSKTAPNIINNATPINSTVVDESILNEDDFE